MKKPILAAVAMAILAPAVASATTTTYYSGQSCVGVNSRDVFQWWTDQGTRNPADYDLPVVCPASWTASAANGQGNAFEAVTAATLVYTDTSSGSFGCRVIEENWDGSVYSSATLYSCGQYGGCTSDSDRGYQGGGQLNFVNPINGGAGLYATSIAFDCNVPGSGSQIRGYNFSLN